MNSAPHTLLANTHFPGYEVVPEGAKAGLVVVHGIAEHGWRYRHVAAALARSGIATFVYDQRGHGHHPGPRTDIPYFADFARDLESVGAAVAQRHPTLPLFVWGHSMGSVIVTLAALDGLHWARGVITTGCALDALPRLHGIRGLGARLAVRLLPKARISLGIDGSVLTHVEEIQRQHMSDPLVPRSASLRLLHGFALACATCIAGTSSITKPWLAVHGDADKVCPVSGSTWLQAQLGSSDKQLKLFTGLRHEIHNEDPASREALFELMSGWILSRAGTETSPSAPATT